MTAIDWIIVAFTLAMALWGYSQGLIVGALSLAGFAGGAILGARIGPLLLTEGASSPYAPLVSLLCAAILGGIFASGLEVLGFHLRGRIGNRFSVLDGLGGSLLLACLGLGLAWIAGAVALQTPGARELREDVQRSEILKRLNSALPPSGPILNALARFDPLPQITGPAPDVRPPTARIARDPEVRAAARQRRARARDRVRARSAGFRLGGAERHGRHQRARRGRPGRHDGPDRGLGAEARRGRHLVRREERPRAAPLVGHRRARRRSR